MALRFEAEAVIDATPDAVWAVLADLPGWDRWNTVVPVAPPPLAPGVALTLALSRRGRTVEVGVRVIVFEPARRLAWRGGVPGLLTAVHGFDLRPEGAGCRIVHHETFRGLLAPLLPWVLGPGHAARYAAVHERLAAVLRSG